MTLQGDVPGMSGPSYPGNSPVEWSRELGMGEDKYREPPHDWCLPENAPYEFDDDTMICYGLVSKDVKDLDPTFNSETEDLYYVREDPEDPIFYSTCYKLIEPKSFSEANGDCPACEADMVQTESSPQWDYGNKCVSCDAATTLTAMGDGRFWDVSNDCEECF